MAYRTAPSRVAMMHSPLGPSPEVFLLRVPPPLFFCLCVYGRCHLGFESVDNGAVLITWALSLKCSFCQFILFYFIPCQCAGEYHLDLIVDNGAVPIIVPRVSGIAEAIDSFEPIHGVLLCEGEDVSPSLYESDSDTFLLTQEEIENMRKAHVSDVAIDVAKDSIELRAARRCLERSIPFLGICQRQPDPQHCHWGNPVPGTVPVQI